MIIQAIQTWYKGYRFRSRLEARWAVFFDALGIRYQYEPQGFSITSIHDRTLSSPYLPDFYLPELECWVEVKGSLDGVNDEYLMMIADAIDWGGCLPGVRDSAGGSRGLLWLGPIPDDFAESAVHLIFQHDKGGWINPCCWLNRTIHVPLAWNEYFDSSWGQEAVAPVVRKTLRKFVYDEPQVFVNLQDAAVRSAYTAARSARFEHGEKGAG